MGPDSRAPPFDESEVRPLHDLSEAARACRPNRQRPLGAALHARVLAPAARRRHRAARPRNAAPPSDDDADAVVKRACPGGKCTPIETDLALAASNAQRS